MVTGSGISEELDAMEIDRVFSGRRSERGGTHRDRLRCEPPDLPSAPESVCRAGHLNARVILDLFQLILCGHVPAIDHQPAAVDARFLVAEVRHQARRMPVIERFGGLAQLID